MSKIEDLAALVAVQGEEIAALRTQLAAQTPARKAIPAPRTEEGVRILTGRAATGAPRIALPTDAEYRQLREIVDLAYPSLRFKPTNPRYAETDAADDHKAFKVAFVYLAELGRSDRLATKYAVSWWMDGCRVWADEAQISVSLTGRGFLAALVAHGDIAYTDLADYPVFGIAVGAGPRPYREAWRPVLSTGTFLAPVAKPGPRQAPPSPVQILMIGGDMQ